MTVMRMRTRWQALILLGLCLPSSAMAQTRSVQIGQTHIVVPAPQGMEPMDENTPVGRFLVHFTAAGNVRLASYVERSPFKQTRQDGAVMRMCSVQATKGGQQSKATEADFASFRQVVKNQLLGNLDGLQKLGNDQLKASSDRASAQTGRDITVQARQLGPQPPHVDNARQFAFTMTAKAEASNAESAQTSDVAVTSTALLVEGRILFLYCAAQAQDMGWTREVSRLWADAIVEHNPH